MGQHTSPSGPNLTATVTGIWSWMWWRDALERSIRTALAVLLTAWGGQWANLYTLGWAYTWRLLVGVTVVTLVFAFVAAPVGQRDSASLLPMPRS